MYPQLKCPLLPYNCQKHFFLMSLHFLVHYDHLVKLWEKQMCCSSCLFHIISPIDLISILKWYTWLVKIWDHILFWVWLVQPLCSVSIRPSSPPSFLIFFLSLQRKTSCVSFVSMIICNIKAGLDFHIQLLVIFSVIKPQNTGLLSEPLQAGHQSVRIKH